MAKASTGPENSTRGFTGMYLACPVSPVFHRQPVAVPISRGAKSYWLRCECGFRAYLPRKWTGAHGLTEKQALAMGLLITTSNLT